MNLTGWRPEVFKLFRIQTEDIYLVCGDGFEEVKQVGAMHNHMDDLKRIEQGSSHLWPYPAYLSAVIVLPILGVLYKNKVR